MQLDSPLKHGRECAPGVPLVLTRARIDPFLRDGFNAREISDLLYFDFDRPERAERKAGGSEKENSMMEWIMVRIATPMPAEMSPYSIAVTPASSFAIRSC
jgi:hypothetical protein